jgi:prevent-host-death family protein
MSTSPISKPSKDFRDGTREQSSVTATDAKNEFGQLLETVIRGGRVFITRHNAPKAVLISVEDFEALSASANVNADAELDALNREFDVMLARMQEPGTREKMKAAFHASPKELGKAAVEFARKNE